MNKYLLLRDNKQSGPYTVSEIIQLGIKPYDLVWQEGKSIAWRYPSELPELKEYAPAVEEQPFDRFYKKPESSVTPATTVRTEHAAYIPKASQPVISNETSITEDIVPTKKVYINFPAHVQPEKKQIPVTPQYVPSTPNQPAFASNQPHVEEQRPKFPERINSNYNDTRSQDKKPVYYAGAAALILIGFIVVLLVNNRNQQEKLKELNTIVKEIETKNASQSASQQASVVSNTQPSAQVPPQVSETIVNPELLADNNDYNTPAAPVTQPQKKNLPPATIAEPDKANKVDENSSGVVYKQRPVLRRTDTETAKPISKESAESLASPENIFKLVDVSANQYKTGVLGGISNLQLHITNNSKEPLHKVAVVVKYLGPEKKVVNTQTVYFENVAPGQKATIDVPKSRRGVSIDYVVTDIKS